MALRVARKRARRAGDGFPERSPLASIGQHVAIDVGEDHVLWARSRPSRNGLCLLEWGKVDARGEQEAERVLREIAGKVWIRAVRIEVPIRSPELRHRRLSLPALTPKQAYKIGRRRSAEFLAEQNEPCIGSFMRIRRKGAFPIWLVAVPATAPELFERRWRALGFDVHRLSSEPLALGNLARLLPPNGPGQLTAIFDVHREGGDCVICDDQGWLFNRVIGVRAARARSAPGAGATSRIANDADEEGALEPGVVERLTTELQRTMQYVQRELHLGTVTRVALAGDLPGLGGLAAALRRGVEANIAPIGELVVEGPARGLDTAAARVVGLAMAPDRRGCSLLPPESKLRQAVRAARMQLRAVLCAVLVLGIAGALSSTVRVYGARRAVAGMSASMGSNERRLEIIAETARERADAHALLEGMQVLRRPEPPWQALLATLAAAAPADVALEELHVARGPEAWQASLVLEARGASVAEAAEQVSRLGERLRAAPFLAPAVAERDASRSTIQEEQRARVFFQVRTSLGVLLQDIVPAGQGAEASP